MCSRDSGEVLQLGQRAHCSKVGILVQKLPICSVLFTALYRKVWIGHLMSWCLHPFHMLWLCRVCLFTVSIEVLIRSSRISTLLRMGGGGAVSFRYELVGAGLCCCCEMQACGFEVVRYRQIDFVT